MIRNREFKAKVDQIDTYERLLQEKHPKFIGTDFQRDIYYKVDHGRKLKLREGNIENALIYYERPELAEEKSASILVYRHQPDSGLKMILETLHGIDIIVFKERKIYFCDNVKIHFDKVEKLGCFIEVEAIADEKANLSNELLEAQCHDFRQYLGIAKKQLMALSYADLLKQLQ